MSSEAGYITRQALLDDLRTKFKLVDRPDHRSDWIRLKELAGTSAAQVSDSIVGRVHLPRGAEVERLQEAVNQAPGAVLLGPSGVGKSAIAKRCIEYLLVDGAKCLWFEGRSFERVDFAAFEADLQLAHGLAELMRSVPDSRAVVVLDGLDRIYDGNAFALVAWLLKILELDRQGSPWHAVVTCQTQEWPRLQQSLLQAGIPTTHWRVVECTSLSVEDLRPVWAAIPSAARLQYQAKLHPLLVNLKILDLIAVRLHSGSEVLTSNWVGESSVAAWFMATQIARGSDGPLRARFVALLAERQADTLRPGVSLHDFNVSDLPPLAGLVNDRVCRRTPSDQVFFEHDVFGDWARLQVLLSHSEDVEEFIERRLDSPLWHRAIRLYGIHLLEHVGNIDKWRAILTALAREGDGVVQDLLLEATIFAADPVSLLERIHPDLARDDGRLLRRLLGRFLAFATVPNPCVSALAQAEGVDSTGVAGQYLYPNWPYWPPMLRFLHQHRDELVPSAPLEVGRVVQLWLSHAPDGTMLRREAAELGLMLGERALRAWVSKTDSGYKHRKLYYGTALAGALELPDNVASFALRASEQSIDTSDADTAPLDRDRLPMTILLDPGVDLDEQALDPWADEPTNRVDDDFRAAVLETAALRPLIRVRPATAREVALAVLIKPRRRFAWDNHRFERIELDLEGGRRWDPPLYTHGPFLDLLRVDFDEGLELVAQLVHFATERWFDYTQMDAREYDAKQAVRVGGLWAARSANARIVPSSWQRRCPA